MTITISTPAHLHLPGVVLDGLLHLDHLVHDVWNSDTIMISFGNR